MQRLYTRDEYMHRIEWMKNARRPIAITSDIIVGFPGETQQDFEETLDLLKTIEFDSIFGFKYSRRPNTPALALDDQIPEEEKTRRLGIVQELQREIQTRRNADYVGTVEECLVEGFNKATGQWIGRTSRHKTLNFLRPASSEDILGSYVDVRVTRAGANSLVGECVN
jgi:tRNA-2-methylthio-N6-dimethylallyladenosine synthase